MKRRIYLLVSFVAAALSAQMSTAEPQVGDRFGDWSFECTAQSASQIDCGIAQLVVAQGSNEPIARFRVTGTSDAAPGQMTALIPLGINLKSPITAQVDGDATVPLSPLTCVAQGCILTMDVTPELAETLSGGSQMIVTYTTVGGGQQVSLGSSLNGLSEAFKATGWY